MEAENKAAKEVIAQANQEESTEQEDEKKESEEEAETVTEEAENAVSMQQTGANGFQRVLEKQYQYDWSLFPDADSVVKEFYAVDSTTSAKAADINIESFLKKDLTIDKNLFVTIQHSSNYHVFYLISNMHMPNFLYYIDS